MKMKKLYLCVILLLLFSNLFAEGRSVVLSWDSNTESDLAGYRVYYGTSSKNYDTTFSPGKVTSVVIPDLAKDKRWYFVVTAYDFSGNESDFSDEVDIKVTDTTPPDKPTDVKVRIIIELID